MTKDLTISFNNGNSHSCHTVILDETAILDLKILLSEQHGRYVEKLSVEGNMYISTNIAEYMSSIAHLHKDLSKTTAECS